MSSRGLTKENLLFAFPSGLRENSDIAALGDVTAEALAARMPEIARMSLYPRIDELPEDLLDILAYDFKIDWWDPNYTLEEKRQTFKDSWRVHKLLGTKAAVETAIRAIYPLTTVEEWFEYEGGQPYHFRLRIDITSDSGDRERQKRVLERLNFYKNLRSHVDEIKYFLVPEKSWAVVGGSFVGSQETDRAVIPVPPLKKPGGEFIAVAGGGFIGSRSENHAEIPVPPLQRPGGKTTVSAVGVYTGSWSKDHAAIKVPPLQKAGGKTTAAAGGGFIGTRSVDHAAIQVPPLQKAGGKTIATAGGVFTGTWSKDYAVVQVPPLQRVGGSAVVSPAGALRGMYRKIRASIPAPELAQHGGTATRAAAGTCIGSIERAAVKLDTGRVKAPTGRAAASGTAGVFHSYQRLRVSVRNPAATISGR